MKRLCLVLLAVLCVSATPAAPRAGVPAQAMEKQAAADSVRLEQELQRLSWRQFRSVVESVPQLKSAVDAYGPAGWQFVQANYRNYGWRRNIDKLNPDQRRELAARIERARSVR